MKTFLSSVLLLFSVCMSVWSVPARSIPFTVIQKDGTSLQVILCGDEHFHYYLSSDSVPLVRDEDNTFYYAQSYEGGLTKSNLLAHSVEGRSRREKDFCSSNSPEAWRMIRTMIAARRPTQQIVIPKTKADRTVVKTLYSGKKKGLIILVNFADLRMLDKHTNKIFHDMANEDGYTENGHIGSVRDYFLDQSYGMLDISFDVVGPVTLERNYAYYGKNDPIYGNDRKAHEMVIEACRLADSEVDFSDYDWNGDGEAEQVFIIYAGYSESSGAPSNTIWPHKSILGNNNFLVLDQTRINVYACSSELAYNNGDVLDGIGTICHEFSHTLGLPDLYDTGGRNSIGMEYWDIMAAGNYSGPMGIGEVPCGYSAYERWCLGWLDMIELEDTCRILDMPYIGDSPTAYLVRNPNFKDEYFILENRQARGWHSYLRQYPAGHGMLVTHVDYSERAWERNEINIYPDHQRVCFVPANRSFSFSSVSIAAGHLFPGTSGISELTDISHKTVGIKLFNPNLDGSYYLHKPITRIRENNGLISFDFMGGIHVPVPMLSETTHVVSGGFTAEWKISEEVDSFTVEALELRPNSSLIDSILNPLHCVRVSGITEERYTFTDLKTDGYKFRVKAMKDEASSDWSPYKEVYLKGNSVITVQNDMSSDSEIEVYDLSGRRFSKIPEKGGIYIVKSGNFVRKVVKR